MSDRDEPPPTRTRILLVSGWAGAGKDAVANILGTRGYKRVAFADPLKRHVAAIAGIPVTVFHDRATKDQPLRTRCPIYPTARTPRDILLQHARIAREADPDVYAREIADEIYENAGIQHWTISDWRYRREYDFLRSSLSEEDYDIIRVRVVRPGITPSTDPTEHDLVDEEMDHIIINDSTLDVLRRNVETTLVRRYGRSQRNWSLP